MRPAELLTERSTRRNACGAHSSRVGASSGCGTYLLPRSAPPHAADRHRDLGSGLGRARLSRAAPPRLAEHELERDSETGTVATGQESALERAPPAWARQPAPPPGGNVHRGA